jgi:RNA polymerase sigma factor (sigma-70 family)
MTESGIKDINLIRAMAHSFHRTTGVDLEELLSEATIAYLEALRKWNPQKGGSPSTLAVYYIRGRLSHFTRKDRRARRALSPLEQLVEVQDEEGKSRPDIMTEFKDRLARLSPDSREVCNMIFTAPHRYRHSAPRFSRGQLNRDLREAGWIWSRIWKTSQEIKEVLALG